MMQSRAIREGSIGLFALLGLAIFAGIAIWLRGGGVWNKSYQFVASFPTVDGMQIGAPVRFRGVTVGKIVKLKPTSNMVEATLEIDSTNLQIPKKVIVQTNRYGLIGDTSVDLLPTGALPSELSKIDPLSEKCDPTMVICHDDRLEGVNSPDIFASTIELAEIYSDPKFVKNLTNATRNASIAASRIARLSDDASIVLKSAQKDFSTAAREFTALGQSARRTAAGTSRLIDNTDSLVSANRTRITQTVDDTSHLVSNLNLLIGSNRTRIVQTIDEISAASSELNRLALNLNTTVGKVNQTLEAADTQSIAQNLQTLTANAVAVSSDLRNLSNSISDPTILVTLQQTLDSARVTFANTQKLSSDLNELLGDPKLRENIRILIDGLSNLVSSTDHLEEQLRIAESLELARQNLAQSPTDRLDLSDFQPNRPYLLPSQPKMIPDREENAQKSDSVKD